jgi:hypothetical protein
MERLPWQEERMAFFEYGTLRTAKLYELSILPPKKNPKVLRRIDGFGRHPQT